MAAKSVLLEGYGTIMVQPISIRDKDYDVVDPTGKSVEHKTIGTRARSVYVTADGIEIPNNQVCKRIPIEGEELIIPKFEPTKEVIADNIVVLDDGSLIYRAIDRKFYNVVTDNKKIKELILEQNKSLEFPFIAGSGWKMWKAILTNWNGKLLMVACQGDLQKELEKYSEETVDIELEIIPKQENMRKLVRAMAMV